MSELTHFNKAGRAKMVDVSEKKITARVAKASGKIYMSKETINKVLSGHMNKGDVLAVAQVAGINGAKKTWELIPMCHNLLLTGVDIEFTVDDCHCYIEAVAEVKTQGNTGVEMEALTAVNIALLTVYDMCKAIDKRMYIEEVKLIEKQGGKSDFSL
ncbi:cyclic pyranopterin monophosphate synthase MoaC [Proteinivorax tanatarense]|uniref:Cyclic pyranopterin monophosphate synthase n=1 Tax=Proteinivorax tanatarense TaxID=1260629 RepID=A0AAU7VLU7_9FIRM